jgi:TfoX/Sxy family transcriptional regulator of competence genes
MAYDQKLADRIRERLSNLSPIQEKEMMGGLAFMYKNKMCVGIFKDEMMCRIDPDQHETAVEKTGCRTMDFTGKPMKGWVLVDETGIRSEKDFEYWISICLEYNSKARASKKKKRN